MRARTSGVSGESGTGVQYEDHVHIGSLSIIGIHSNSIHRFNKFGRGYTGLTRRCRDDDLY